MSYWHHVFHRHHGSAPPPAPVAPTLPPPIVTPPPVLLNSSPKMGSNKSRLTASAKRRDQRASVLGLQSATAAYAPSTRKATSSVKLKSRSSGLQIRK